MWRSAAAPDMRSANGDWGGLGEDEKPERDRECHGQQSGRRRDEGMDEFLTEPAIRRIVAAGKSPPGKLGRVILGIAARQSQSGRSRDERSGGQRRMDMRLDDKALDDDREQGKERGNPIHRGPEYRAHAPGAQAPGSMRISASRFHGRLN